MPWSQDGLSASRKVAELQRLQAHQAHCAHLHIICWAVLLGVVREDSGPVEGAVILWEGQPAFEAVRTLAADADPDDVR